ncbi:MAG: heparinase II/III family protein [Bacteroidales bacterium]|nr:heparinase II/III family protein [Bacteroidales bacterium]
MKKYILILLLALISQALIAETVTSTVDTHPHLLVSNGRDFATIDSVSLSNPMLAKIRKYIVDFSEETLSVAPQERKMKGRRLLNAAVECCTRIFYLSYAYRVTGDLRYERRAVQEMLSVASYEEWNPSHFLDVSEMMVGMSIGYDWLYCAMSPEERETIRTAIIEKGLKMSFVPEYSDFWLGSSSNWNQVCNAACTMASIALIDTNPEYAEKVVPRAVTALERPMTCYRPDGAYREGPGYWCYGTGYNCLFLAAVEKYYGTDFGLLDKFPVFLNTVKYHIAMMTPTLEVFTYADQAFPAQISIAPFYLYEKTGDSSYLFMLKRILDTIPIDLAHCRHRRILPAALVFAGLGGTSLRIIDEPDELFYIAQGRTPVAAFRSDWNDRNAWYLGLKCGSPKERHHHMDEGRFYLEAAGVRWALHPGGEVYSNIEKAGVDLWGYEKTSDRWRLLRTGLWGHNCLILNGHDQNIEGRCQIDESGTDPDNMYALTDLSSLYGEDARSVSRKVSLISKDRAVIEDRIVTGEKKVKLRWQMATEAEVFTPMARKAELISKDGKIMTMTVSGNIKPALQGWSAEPMESYESKNPGKKFVGFTANLKPGTEYVINVTFTIN